MGVPGLAVLWVVIVLFKILGARFLTVIQGCIGIPSVPFIGLLGGYSDV